MASGKKGFTLVELLIVVIIIGVMTFVAVPRMGFSIITGSKAQTNAQKIAAAIRYARSLAIANAATNNQGFSLNMTGSPYTGFQIVNLKTSDVNETGSIDPKVSCTGANDFSFGPLGNRLLDSDSLTVSAGGKTYTITVVSATGMVKCQ
ncbi:MAG: prepilin-type N-terminal cleavage/methylation domain-containing protein [Phycisphaerae bacterium]|nr:prepilin-type N-terminal cleavage/methylation domain-containing protein [Phycisphaerae bacterium]